MIDLTTKLPRHPTIKYKPRDLHDIDYIVLHHTAGPKDQTPESIARYHVDVKGWSGIAYNYLIYDDGEVFKTRPVSVVPVCVYGHNTNVICVCLVGNFVDEDPSQRALTAMAWLVREIRAVYPWIRGVRGHREMPGQATLCPGFDVSELRHYNADLRDKG